MPSSFYAACKIKNADNFLQSALKHFIGKLYMSLGVLTNLLAAELTKICWKFQCVGIKNCSVVNFFQDFM